MPNDKAVELAQLMLEIDGVQLGWLGGTRLPAAGGWAVPIR